MKKNLFSLRKIKETDFTSREIDVISCILHNRSTKKTAFILSIAPRTVETHIHNIMSKIGCNSRDGIIDFIETSKDGSILKEHYINLQVESKFIKTLKKIGSITPSKTSCYIDLRYISAKEFSIIKDITNSLNNAHITVFRNIENVKEIVSNSFKLYPLSFDKLNIFKEEFEHKYLKDSSIIFLLLEDNIKLPMLNQSNKIYYTTYKTYYTLIFDLLRMLLSKVSIEKIVLEFNAESEILRKGLKTKASEFYISKKQRSSWVKKNVFFLGSALTLVVLCIIFLILILKSKHGVLEEENSKSNIIKDNFPAPLTLETKKEKQQKTWNLPHSLAHYINRKEIIDLIWSKFSEEKHLQHKVILLGLSGMSGVGKTTLAQYIIHHPQQRYHFKGWFSAETKDLLKRDYFELGEKHALFPHNFSDKQKIMRIKEWLEEQENSLLVYDNAESIEMLNEYLPQKGHIIITSRNYKLPGLVEVYSMTEEEAVKLLNALIPSTIKQGKDYEKMVKILAENLSYLPLALSQAGAYIAENMLRIQEYLSLYATEKAKLLSDDTMPPMDQHEPVYVTWDISIEKIKKNPNGQKALELLNFISYCYSENIPKKLLAQHLYNQTNNAAIIKLNNVINLLRKYSLIKVSPHVSIHRLLSSFLKMKHDIKDKTEYFKNIISTITTLYPGEDKTTDDINFIRLLLPHIESILSEIKSILPKVEYVSLINILGDIYYTFGNYHQSKKLFEKILSIQEQKLESDHVQISYILYYIGKIERNLGHYNESKQLLERALAIQQKHYGIDHIKMAPTLAYLGRVERNLGHYNESKALLERALAIQQNHYGTDHVDTSYTLTHLGIAECSLGHYNESKALLEKALAIQQKHYGPDHVDTSYTLTYLGRAASS